MHNKMANLSMDLDQLDRCNSSQVVYREDGNEEEKQAAGVLYNDQYFKQMQVHQWVKVLSQG